ncbi:MAG: sodium:proton exchanger [Dehalococcoidales bacterium]|nr:sodium:proton exchanger [Dehalococcoidales bacterium]|tara:strand:- start:2641 stop:4359 length:1719 start_codon:yes stop_codon:yes gene_type:complete
MEQSELVINFTILLGAALVGGMVAHRLRQPVILGYILIGIAIGPHALSLVNDLVLIEGAATLGVALLMMTLGLEISFSQLKQVGKIGLWGGMIQILVTFALGVVVSIHVFHWSISQAVLFGFVISLSSTMVCFKMLMDRGELDSIHGRIMVAMLILQDISVVLMIVITPVLGEGGQNLPLTLGISIGKAVLTIGVAIVIGLWILPWLMGRIGGVRSRELFLLTVLVMGLGAAISTQIFGLSAVFGAFLIGLVLRETRFGHQALAEITPLRDIFAALFFVSLGMLLDPGYVVEYWQLVTVTVALIIFIKFVTVSGIVRLFGYRGGIPILAGGGLLQIGEFSFILAAVGVEIGIFSSQSYALIIASAIITMLITPISMGLVSRFSGRLGLRSRTTELKDQAPLPVSKPAEIVTPIVIAGFGRVGQNIARGLKDVGIDYSVIEIDPERVSDLQHGGTAYIYGDASNANVLSRGDLAKARVLVVTFPDPLAVVITIKNALAINPDIRIVARVHRVREAELLRKLGIEELISPEYEASIEFLRKTLSAVGWKKADVNQALSTIQKDGEIAEFSEDDE